MKKSLNALLALAALLGAAMLHAQTVTAEAEQVLTPVAGGLIANLLARPPLLAGVVLGALVFLILVLVLWRRASGKNGSHGFENTYDGGYNTIMPVAELRKDPNLRPLSLDTVTGARKDSVVADWSIPAEFDVPRFLRKAKSAFVRLQKSWDEADLHDIRGFTSKEIFEEFSRQIAVRGNMLNVTEIVTLGAELDSVATVDGYHVARVKFSGLIKEDVAAAIAPFSESWTLSKPLDGHRSWVVANIAQD